MKGTQDLSEITLHHVVPESVRTILSPYMTVQNHGSVTLLSFYDLVPPLVIGSDEQKEATLKTLQETGVNAYCFSRIALTPDHLREVVRLLSDSLRIYESQPVTQESQK